MLQDFIIFYNVLFYNIYVVLYLSETKSEGIYNF